MRALALLLALLADGALATVNETPFLVVSTPGAVAGSLPHDGTEVRARIDGVFADVTVTQRYSNRSPVPVEAVYVVPAAPGLAMHRFEVRVGDRVLRAKIERKREAREQFVAARRAGKKASLLEQYGDEAFRMSIANILPGDSISVELRYSQVLESDAGAYSLTFAPPVVARFHGERRAAPKAEGAFEVVADFATPVPLAAVAGAPDARIERPSPTEARVRHSGAGTPFTLNWSLRGDALADGLLIGADENGAYFMLQVQPPATPDAAAVLPREYLFVVDRAAVGYGFSNEAYRYLMAQLLGALRPEDRYNVVAFDDKARAFTPAAQHAGPDSIARCADWLARLRPNGYQKKGFDAALDLALATPRATGTARIVVLVSDGLFKYDLARRQDLERRFRDATLVPFGVGGWINAQVLESIAHVEGSEAVVLVDATQGDLKVRHLRTQFSQPLIAGVRIEGEGVTFEAVSPQAEVFAGRPLVVLGRYSGEGTLVVRGETRSGPWERRHALGRPAPNAQGAALGRAWARWRIENMLDELLIRPDAARVNEATDFALAYSIATPYTSFVAVEEKYVPPPPEKDEAAPPPAGDLLAERAGGVGFLARELEFDARDAGPSMAAPVPSRALAPVRDAPLVAVIFDAGRADDPFYAAAARHYALRGALVVRGVGSLEAATAALARVARDLGAPLGEVRFVVHGAPWSGLATALTDGGAPLDAERLASILATRAFAPLAESVVDARTRIVIDGCGLGDRAELLEAVAVLVGGDDPQRPRIEAPRAFVWFTSGPDPKRIELAYTLTVTPGRAEPDDADRVYPVRILVRVGDPAELERAGVRRWVAGQPGLEKRLAALGLMRGDLAWREEHGDVVGEGRVAIRFAPSP